MRSFDFSPLYRSTVGFDRLANIVETMLSSDNAPSYPPYNIEKMGDDAYRISLAVAGFTENDIEIETCDGILTVRGRQAAKAESPERQFLHRGIAERSFERRFQLADHVRVQGATLAHGLLHIDLLREAPEALKPRRIPIGQTLSQLTAEAA